MDVRRCRPVRQEEARVKLLSHYPLQSVERLLPIFVYPKRAVVRNAHDGVHLLFYACRTPVRGRRPAFSARRQ